MYQLLLDPSNQQKLMVCEEMFVSVEFFQPHGLSYSVHTCTMATTISSVGVNILDTYLTLQP